MDDPKQLRRMAAKFRQLAQSSSSNLEPEMRHLADDAERRAELLEAKSARAARSAATKNRTE
jgi:hypothetical protein